MIVRKTYKAESRKDYGCDRDENDGIGLDGLKTGCLMRIADATEVMAKRYQDLIDERDRYKRWHKELEERWCKAVLRIAALKGVITKLKKARQGA